MAKGKANPTSGTLKDLTIGLVYLLFLLILTGVGTYKIFSWKNNLDIKPKVIYEQMEWSNKDDKLAFVRTEERSSSHKLSKRSGLWICDRFGLQLRCLLSSLPINYDIVGWFAEDQKIILCSHNKPLTFTENSSDNQATISEVEKLTSDQSALSLILVNTQDGKKRYFTIQADNLHKVGSNKDELLFAQYTDNRINLLSWQPDSTVLKLLTTVSTRPTEHMIIKQIVSSPDNEKLAIVISILEQNKKEENNENQQGVWLFDKKSGSISWTTISANNSKDMSLAWSLDSSWLGGVAQYDDEAELFAFHGQNNCQAAKIHGIGHGKITPIINTNKAELIFVSENRIDKYDFSNQKSTAILSVDNINKLPTNLAVSPNGAVAYVATNRSVANIYTCTLNNSNSTLVNIPEDNLKNSLAYRLTDKLQYSVDYWLLGVQIATKRHP